MVAAAESGIEREAGWTVTPDGIEVNLMTGETRCAIDESVIDPRLFIEGITERVQLDRDESSPFADAVVYVRKVIRRTPEQTYLYVNAWDWRHANREDMDAKSLGLSIAVEVAVEAAAIRQPGGCVARV